VDRQHRRVFWRWHVVDRSTNDIENSAEGVVAYRNPNCGASIDGIHSALQTIGATESDGSYNVVAQVLRNFADQVDISRWIFNLDCVVNLGQVVARKSKVNNGANYGNNLSGSGHEVLIPLWASMSEPISATCGSIPIVPRRLTRLLNACDYFAAPKISLKNF
jgi:hypothetical protein